MEKFYVIKSEYVQNGIAFKPTIKYIKDKDKANQVFDDLVKELSEDNIDMVENKHIYEIIKAGNKTYRKFYCYYKHNPNISNFSIEMSSEIME